MKIRTVSVKEVEYTAFRLARELMTRDEPIPDFGTRFPNILESCLKVPFQTFNKRSLYRGLVGKGAILFYLLVKNHPFENGNKRIAVITLFLFLLKNNKWLKVDNDELYRFAKGVAASDPKSTDLEVGKIRDFLSTNLTKLS